MPTPAHIQRLVASELAAALSAHTWTTAIPAVAAAFRRVPDYQLEDLGSLKVSVVPGPIGVNGNDQGQPRGADFFEVGVGIVLARHVGSDQEIADLEDLNMAIVDAIRSYHVTLADLPYADWTDISIPTPYDREALTERNVFLSQIEVMWMVPQDKLAAPEPPAP
jgi:hypothetical protein